MTSTAVWQLDRLFRSGALCGLAAWLLPALMAVILSASGESSRIAVALITSVFFMAGASVFGSTIVMGISVLMFAIAVAVDRTGAVTFGVVGAGLYASLMLHSLSVSFRRAPGIDRSIWWGTASTTAFVSIVGWIGLAVAYAVATRSTWDVVFIPLALIMIGLSARYLSDRHQRHFAMQRRRVKSTSLR